MRNPLYAWTGESDHNYDSPNKVVGKKGKGKELPLERERAYQLEKGSYDGNFSTVFLHAYLCPKALQCCFTQIGLRLPIVVRRVKAKPLDQVLNPEFFASGFSNSLFPVSQNCLYKYIFAADMKDGEEGW
jgi:hypothetical protein